VPEKVTSDKFVPSLLSLSPSSLLLPPDSPFPTDARPHRHLQILLFDSERSWAQSQLLKADLSSPSASPKTKHHFHKRFSKATSVSKSLLELSQSPALSARLSAADLGQIQAYHLVLAGSLAFERGKHEEGLETLSAAYEVLSTLAATAGSATEEALANERLDEVEPMLRFCAYRLGKDTAAGVASISKDVAAEALPKLVPDWADLRSRLEEEGKASSREAVEVWWRGELVPVRNAELVGVAVKVKAALASLEQDQAIGKKGGDGSEGKKKAGDGKKEILGARRMGTYDKALLTLSDAEAVAGQLVEDNKVRFDSFPPTSPFLS
jgi:signal recognition particle subunit SRP68